MAGFEPATAANSGPMVLHSYSSANDPADWLSPKAANRLRALRESFEELHSLTIPFDQIREASMERYDAEQRLKRLTDHHHLGGFSLAVDDARVIDQQKLVDKLSEEFARLKARHDARVATWQAAGHTLNAVDTWLRDGRGKVALEDFNGPEPQLLKGESITDGISRLQRRGRELKNDLHRIRSSPFPSAHAKAKVRAEIEALAMRGAPSVSDVIEHDRSVVWPTMSARSQVYNTEIPSVGFAELPDALALFAWAFKDALMKRLDAEIDAEADDKAAMSHEARQKAEAEVQGDLLDIERQEAAFVWQAMAQHLPVLHRHDCAPEAILQCKLVTAPRANLSPETSPGMSFRLRR